MRATIPTALRLRLLHNGAQPGRRLPEALRFGLQGANDWVYPGVKRPDGGLSFSLALAVIGDGTAPPEFVGGFAFGPPSDRFLYLSWKRLTVTDMPWGWQLKIPLGEITWQHIAAAAEARGWLQADATGRKPNRRSPVEWHVETEPEK